MTYGSADASHVSYGFDDRLRVSTYEATSSVLTGGYVRKASYEYMNDGSPKKASNLLDSGFDQNYAFDSIGRLTSSASGTKTNGLNQTVTPYAQSIGYNAFGDITSRSTDVWGGDGGFTASYTNGHKTGGTEIYDAAGNVVDKTTTSTTYDRWKFDASGRNVETAMRWYQTASSPQLDRNETIAKVFDGDGLDTKRVDTKVITQYPANTTTTNEKIEYYVRSSVLGGKTITELDSAGAKKLTKVYTGDGVIAEQRVTSGVGAVNWRHEDLVTGSFKKIDASGNEVTGTPDAPGKTEYEPLGGSIPTVEPEGELALPGSLLQFKNSGDVNRPESGCQINGTPMHCNFVKNFLLGKGLTVFSGGIVQESTWKFTAYQRYDNESYTGNSRANSGEPYRLRGGFLDIQLGEPWFETFHSFIAIGGGRWNDLLKDIDRDFSTLKTGLSNMFQPPKSGKLWGRWFSNPDKDKCEEMVLKPLASLGFDLKEFLSYLGRGKDFYDGITSPLDGNVAFGGNFPKGTIPNGWSVAKVYASFHGSTTGVPLNVLTSYTLSETKFTVFFNSNTTVSSVGLLFHEALHGFGSSINKGKPGSYSDVELKKLFGGISGPSDKITDYIDEHCGAYFNGLF